MSELLEGMHVVVTIVPKPGVERGSSDELAVDATSVAIADGSLPAAQAFAAMRGLSLK